MDQSILRIEDLDLNCTDRHGRNLSTKVQVIKETHVPANSEYQLWCRLINEPAGTTGIIEHYSEADLGVRIATTVALANSNRNVMVQCINPHSTTVEM